jgi:iron(III) transport system permease protein
MECIDVEIATLGRRWLTRNGQTAARITFHPGRQAWLLGVSLVIVLLTALPLLYLVVRSAGVGSEAIEYLLSPRTLTVIGNSLALAFAVAGASLLIGVPFAWLTCRTDLPFRRIWLVAGLLGMVIPSYLGAITFVEVFGPVGVLQQVLKPLGVTRLPSGYGFFGAWVTITLFTFPYVVLPVRAALLRVDPSQEEAARMLGLGRWKVFFRVTLPQLRPALAAGALMTMLYTLSDFGAVMTLRFNAFTRAIYTTYNSSFDRERAALLALTLVAVTAMLVIAERRFSRSGRGKHHAATVRVAPPVKLGRWTLPALGFCLMLVIVSVIGPLVVLVAWAINPNMTSNVSVELEQLALNTVGVSALAAIVTGFAGLPLAILAARSVTRLSKVLVGMSYIGNVLPGLVVGLALVFFAANYAPFIYQTIPLLTLGYMVRFLPLSIGATASALNQVSPRLEEAARTLGCNGLQAARRVTIPLARAGLLGGMALVALSTMKELPTTLLLAPIGFRTLATRAWTAYDSASYVLIGVPGLLLLAVSALTLLVLLWRER